MTEVAGVLFVLIDAADHAGLLTDPVLRERWEASKAHLADSGYEGQAQSFFELLDELERAGQLQGTWIAQRWSMLKRSIETSDFR